jgi:predicted PurR-regulated permease PerM
LFTLLLYTIIPLALLEFNNLLKSFGGLKMPFLNSSSQNWIQIFQFLNKNLEGVGTLLLGGGGSVLDAAAMLLGGVMLVLSVLILSFYLTVSRGGVERFLVSITPEQYEEAVLKVYERVRYRTGRWFQTQIFLSFMIGVAAFIGLWILGVKYSLVLAILAAVFELVPVVGPIFAGAMAVLVALSDSVTLGIYTMSMFLIIQQMESSVVVPVVMRRAVGLHPVVIILALLIGAKIAGFIGIILAIPTAFLVEEIIENYTLSRKRRV